MHLASHLSIILEILLNKTTRNTKGAQNGLYGTDNNILYETHISGILTEEIYQGQCPENCL